ncbi:SRPBCC family protein [Paracoccus chinensis]|uniref:Polyketide cyclase / dehydrase and lipid transport n=1 Tax=Paracoccus chinensis TaxID=525640 RepID=A0A1G9K6G5_9RHOB|nr:SRPBCC family protein [Paracoccus chinensis]SDL45348.1 Polyketide cyclase / dehydrase and lipid transport [Paracoccus chinensis]
MKSVLALMAAAAILTCGTAQAHGPVRLKLELSETLNATPDEVWATVGRFDDMSWHPAVARTELTSADATTPDGSTRVLHLKAESGDPTISEQLTKWQPEKRCYGYMITQVDVAVLPVTNYAATLCVNDEGGKAKVVWKGGFYRGYPNNDPPAELNDEAATAAVTGIYQGGLDALAEKFGRAE